MVYMVFWMRNLVQKLSKQFPHRAEKGFQKEAPFLQERSG